MKVSQLTIQNNGVNKGEMFLHELNGKGSFQQSRVLMSQHPRVHRQLDFPFLHIQPTTELV